MAALHRRTPIAADGKSSSACSARGSKRSSSRPSACSNRWRTPTRCRSTNCCSATGAAGQGSSFDRQRAEQATPSTRSRTAAQRAAGSPAQRPAEPAADARNSHRDGGTASQKRRQLNRSLCFLATWETNFVAESDHPRHALAVAEASRRDPPHSRESRRVQRSERRRRLGRRPMTREEIVAVRQRLLERQVPTDRCLQLGLSKHPEERSRQASERTQLAKHYRHAGLSRLCGEHRHSHRGPLPAGHRHRRPDDRRGNRRDGRDALRQDNYSLPIELSAAPPAVPIQGRRTRESSSLSFRAASANS